MTLDSAEFHEAVRLFIFPCEISLKSSRFIGLWGRETNSSRKSHHVRCVQVTRSLHVPMTYRIYLRSSIMTRPFYTPTGHVAKLVGMPTYSRHVGQGKQAHATYLLRLFARLSNSALMQSDLPLTCVLPRSRRCNSAQVSFFRCQPPRAMAARGVVRRQDLLTGSGDGRGAAAMRGAGGRRCRGARWSCE